MFKANWKALLITCLLLPAAATADDTASSVEQDEHDSEAITHAEALRALTEYRSRWQLSHPVETPAYSDSWPHSSSSFDIDVENGSSIMRVAKIRSLSLVTLAGDDRSKWFLGVNEDGIVGVHFRGFTRDGAKRHLDVASLFSPKEETQGDEAY